MTEHCYYLDSFILRRAQKLGNEANCGRIYNTGMCSRVGNVALAGVHVSTSPSVVHSYFHQ